MHISLNYKLYKFQINYKNQSTILLNKKYNYRYIICSIKYKCIL